MIDKSNFFQGKSRQVVVIIIICILLIFLVNSLSAFFNSFLGALIFYVLFRKFMRSLVEKYHWKKWLAATLIIFISFLVIIIPAFGLLYALIGRLQTESCAHTRSCGKRSNRK